MIHFEKQSQVVPNMLTTCWLRLRNLQREEIEDLASKKFGFRILWTLKMNKFHVYFQWYFFGSKSKEKKLKARENDFMAAKTPSSEITNKLMTRYLFPSQYYNYVDRNKYQKWYSFHSPDKIFMGGIGWRWTVRAFHTSFNPNLDEASPIIIF